MLIGVYEQDGAASALTPIAGVDVDKELLCVESVVRTGIEPTIVGLRMKRVEVGGGSVIVINIPRSYNPPHRVIFKNSNRYYSRNSAGAYELSLDELRMLFGEWRTIEERARAFVSERFLRIQADDGALPIPVSDGVVVMHLIPLPDFGAGRRIEIAALRELKASFPPIGATGYSWRINLDGFNVYLGGDVCHGYTQIFRDGSVETTSVAVFVDHGEGRYLASVFLPRELISSLGSFMSGLIPASAVPASRGGFPEGCSSESMPPEQTGGADWQSD